MTIFYCPSCGEESKLARADNPEIEAISPGDYKIRCGNCGTRWVVRVEYYEDEKP